MTDDELWKDVVDYEGLYQISSFGRVKSLKRKGCKEDRILKPGDNDDGYFCVILCKDGKRKTCKIHRLVGTAFLEPVDGCDTIDHKNRDRTDNRVENLRWANHATQAQNSLYFANYICISYKRPHRVSNWIVRWRYAGGKVKAKSFVTKELAKAFAETLDKTQLIPLNNK